MSRSGFHLVVPAVVAPLVAASALTAGWLAPSAAVATSAAVRYASPSGSSAAACTKAHPCSITKAISGASSHDEVVIEPGSYGSKSAPMAETLGNGKSLAIHGETGHALPVIYSSAQVALTLGAGSLSHVKVVTSGRAGIVEDSGTVDHVVVIDSGSDSSACSITESLSDSLCVASGAHSIAVALAYAPPATGVSHLHPTVFGITAEATATTGTGLQLLTGDKTVATVRVTNSILHGGKVDAEAATDGATASATVVLKHTDFKTSRHTGTNGAPAVSADATDIHARPAFVDPAADNFAEKASSATINKGTAAPTGDTDVAGHPRWFGSAPDMGAYEFRQPPLIAGLTITHSSAHTASFSVQVNPEGLGTKVQVIAVLGSKRVKSSVARAGAGRAYRTVHLHIKGLHARSLYHIDAVATNNGGKGHTQKKSLRTGA
jgi:hypothetical protein